MNTFKIDEKDELFWVVVATFLVAGLVASTINLNSGLNNSLAKANQNKAQKESTSVPVNTASNTKSVVAASGGTDTISDKTQDYAEARSVYDYRFQFDKNCRATTGLPSFGTINVKQGASIMLENHGDKTHTLALGNDARSVKAGDFVVLLAPKVTKPTGLYVTCDGGGAGNLFVYP